MPDRSFLDSNILICTDDHDMPEKQAVAMKLFERGVQIINPFIAGVFPPPCGSGRICPFCLKFFIRLETDVGETSDFPVSYLIDPFPFR